MGDTYKSGGQADNPFADPRDKTSTDVLSARNLQIAKIHERMVIQARPRLELERQKALKNAESDDQIRALTKYFDSQSEELSSLFQTLAEDEYRAERSHQTENISGLLRKETFEKMYEESLSRRKPTEKVVMVAFDLDKFKDINETIGHTAADVVLGQVGAAIKKVIRSYDFATRIGGDEFVIMLNKVKPEMDAVNLVQRIGEEISKVTWEKGGKINHITFSAGCTVFPESDVLETDDKPFFSDMREEADFPSRISKKLGRNRLTTVVGQYYVAHELVNGQYVQAEKGLLEDIEADTAESCMREILSNFQRIAEEVERAFGNDLHHALLLYFGKTDQYDLTIHQWAKLLLEARKLKKHGKSDQAKLDR